MRPGLLVDPADPDAPLIPLLIGLTVVTGLVDAASYLLLGRVFVANMTGNVLFIAFALAGAQGFSIPTVLLALVAFCGGAVVGGRIGRLSPTRARVLFLGTATEAGLVILALFVVVASPTLEDAWPRSVVVLLLGLAMGTQNAVVRSLGVHDLTTTVLTMTLTGLAAESSLAGGTNHAFGRRFASTVAMFVGALIGTVIVLLTSALLAMAVPLAGILVVALIAARAVALRGPQT